jgi:hypothetical protein
VYVMRWRAPILLIAFIIGSGYFLVAKPPTSRPGNYREAVKLVLNQAGFSYRDVEVTDGCAPTYERCRTYAGRVQVLTQEATLAGRIECRRRWTNCMLSLPNTGVAPVELPNIVDPLPLSLEEAWASLQDWFDQITRSSSESVRPVAAHDVDRARFKN